MSEITVLFVDDEQAILKSYRRLLRKEDYRILTADSGEEAINMLAEYEVHVLVTDQQMPGMSGCQLLSHVRETYPEIVRVTISGYACADAVRETVQAGAIDRFLVKPWKTDDLRASVQQSVQQYRLSTEGRTQAVQNGADPEFVSRLTSLRDDVVAERIMEAEDDVTCVRFLPYPSVCIDAEGRVVCVHESVGRFWPQLAGLGASQSVSTAENETLVSLVNRTLEGGDSTSTELDGEDGMPRAMHSVPLIDSRNVLGCVILMESHQHAIEPQVMEVVESL